VLQVQFVKAELPPGELEFVAQPLQTVEPVAASGPDNLDIMCSTAVFSSLTVFAPTSVCEDADDFDVSFGKCSTYAGGCNEGFC
jgi:hypothetical protein